MGHLFYDTLSFVHHFNAIAKFKLKLQSGNTQFGSKSTNFLAVWHLNFTDDVGTKIRAPLLCYSKLCASFRTHWWIQTGVTVRKHPIWVKFDDFFSRVTLKFDWWPCKTIGHLFYATSSFVHHFVASGEFKLELQSGNAQFGSNSTVFEPCDLEIWLMTLQNNKAPILSNIKPYASFHNHMWIQTGVTVRRQLGWVVTSVTLTFDLWPWTFAWTLSWSLWITPEHFMMIQWSEHSQKGVTDRQTDRKTQLYCIDGQKIPFIELLGGS